MSAYRTATDQTTAVIDRRARYFRNQVVIVVAIAVLAVGAALVWSAAALWAWLLLVPSCGLYFYADSRALNGWRSSVLGPWTARDLDLVAWGQAIRANPVLPKETTGAMLATLPIASDLVTEQKILTPTRRAIAAECIGRHSEKGAVLLLNALASGLVVAILLSAVWMRAWAPMLGLLALAALPLFRMWIGRRWRWRCEKEVAACRTEVGFSEEDYARLRAEFR